MKELFEQLPRADMNDTSKFILLDTCFIIHTFEHQNEHKLVELMSKSNVGITSFNVGEFLYKEHSVDERVREGMRRVLKKHPNLTVINVNVVPGNRNAEINFVNSVDQELLKEVPDPSDAVLIAAAIRTKSIVMTKDKHHLFTTKLENYLSKYEICVYKDYHDLYQNIYK